MSEWSGEQIKTEIEIGGEFCASTEDIKCGRIETGDINPVISPEYYGMQMYETSPELSALISQYNVNVSSLLRCRLCAMPNNDMVDIFSSVGTEETILDKVRKSLPIVIEESDGLPKQACRTCLATLELCYRFHQTVVKAERQLRALDRLVSGNLETTNIHNEPYPARDGQRVPTEYNKLDGSLKTTFDVEKNNRKSTNLSEENQMADTTVNSNGLLSNLRPCSVVIPIMEICGKDNSAIEDRRTSSSDDEHKNSDSTTEALFSGRNHQSTGDFGVHLNSPDIRAPAQVGERRYRCDTCAKTFKRKSYLIQHNVVHLDKKNYTCKYCGKKFASRRLEEYHNRRIHLKKGTFKCLLCEKSFIIASELKRHAVVHTEDRNYHCFLCDKSFKSLEGIKRHMKIHTNT